MSESGGPHEVAGSQTLPAEAPPPAPAPDGFHLPEPGLPKSVGWVLALFLSQVVAGFGLATVIRRPSDLLLFEFSTAWTLLVAVLIVARNCDRPITRALAIRYPGWQPLAVALLLTAPLALVAGEASVWLADALRRAGAPDALVQMGMFTNAVDEIRRSPPVVGVLVTVIFFGLLPAVGEELFFRGFLGRGLVARWGPVWGVLLTTLLFAAIHLHPVQAAGAAVVGVVLHATYLWTRSLTVPVLLHGAYNCLAVLANALTGEARNDLAGDEHLPLGLALTAVAATVGLLSLLYRSRVRWTRTDGSEWGPGFPAAELPPADADARPIGRRPGAGQVAVVAVVYLLFAAALGWELSQ